MQADELRTVLARRSIERAISFADWAGVGPAGHRSGSFLIARTGAHQAMLRREAARSRGWGADIRAAAPADLLARLSFYQPQRR